MKVVIIILLIAILISLGAGLFFLIEDKGSTKRTVYSLTVRIALSVGLFLLLLIGYFTGALQPHGLGG
jgi:hypothetical protein